jgi:hypothetical protein
VAYSDHRSKILGCAMLLAFVLTGLWLLSILMFPGPYTSALPRSFDAVVWKRSESVDGARCGMLADLRFHIGLKGKSRAEVQALLGLPEDEDGLRKTSLWLLCPSFMDIWVLEVRWSNNRVVEDWVRDT